FEIFRYNTTPPGFAQITDTTGGSFGNQVPSISGDGRRIAFYSDRDLVPGGNADANLEIFLHEDTTNSFTQVTNTIGGSGNFNPSISADGTHIAFLSDRDITGGNADGSFEIFLYDVTANNFKQVTNVITATNQAPSINGDGTRIAFASDGNMTAGNSDGNFEIFLYNTATDSFTQVTDTTGGTNANQQPSISDDGKRIAFVSNRFSGGNPDGNGEIFLYDNATGGIAQITFTTLYPLGNSQPLISGDGKRITFVSFHDLVAGGNSDGNGEIFLFDTTANSF